MRITLIHNAIDCRGGAERKLLLIAQRVNQLPGVELDIIVHHYQPTKTFQDLLGGLRITELRADSWFAKFIWIFRAGWRTRNADLIHAHNHPAHMAAAIAKILKRKPVLWFCNEPILYIEGTLKRSSHLKLAILRVIEKILLPQIDLVVANSQNTRGNIRTALGRDAEVIYSGVNTAQLAPLPARAANPRFTISFISRFVKEKNIDLLLRLAELLPEFDFIIGGDGPLEGEIQQRIDAGLKNVRIVLVKQDADKLGILQHADMFACPTPNEPLGINVVEAMSCGLPVVALNSGGAKETVAKDVTGFLVDSEGEFTAKLRLLASDLVLRKTMGDAGRNRVLSTFSLEQMGDKTLTLYRLLLATYGKKTEW